MTSVSNDENTRPGTNSANRQENPDSPPLIQATTDQDKPKWSFKLPFFNLNQQKPAEKKPSDQNIPTEQALLKSKFRYFTKILSIEPDRSNRKGKPLQPSNRSLNVLTTKLNVNDIEAQKIEEKPILLPVKKQQNKL